MNALQVVRTTPRAFTQYEAGFHSSAEKYRERASLIRDSISSMKDRAESTRLLAMASEFEELAAGLEQMRRNREVSGLIGLARRGRG